MKPGARKALILTVFGVIVAAFVIWQVRRLTQPREYDLKSATVTRLDAAHRSGEIEFIHPKSGRAMKVTATNIPADWVVTVNGTPATLADVHVGDKIAVRGLVYVDQTVKPQWIRVTRGEATTRAVAETGPAAIGR